MKAFGLLKGDGLRPGVKGAGIAGRVPEAPGRRPHPKRSVPLMRAEGTEKNAALKAAQCGSSTNPADVRIFGSSTPSSLIPTGRATLRWGSGSQGLPLSASVPEALDPRAKPVPLPQAAGL